MMAELSSAAEIKGNVNDTDNMKIKETKSSKADLVDCRAELL